jgi:broad specificity phosphatase PhoE
MDRPGDVNEAADCKGMHAGTAMTEHHHEIWLFRHGATTWSASGRHTGRTDLPLDAAGRRRAQAIGRRLSGRRFALVLSSPLTRALETCRLAGYGDVAELAGDLVEWDYCDGAPGGETAAEVGARARKVIARAASVDGDVALFAHGHVLRVLTACWLGLQPDAGRLFALGTASVSVLGYEHDTPVIMKWNQDSHLIDVGE